MHTDESYWNERGFINNLVDQIPAAIFWKNTESIFLGCNQYFANLAALPSPQSIIGKTDYDLPWGEHQANLYREDDLQIIRRKKPKMGIEESQTLVNGKVITLLTNKIPLISKQNVVVGVLGVFQDITERKEMELSLEKAKNQAEAANHAKIEFIANMSHDIRTPLSGVIGLSELLIHELQNPNQKQYAGWINDSSKQLLVILNGILDVVSAGHVNEHDLREEIFDLRQCINDIVQLELPTIKSKGLELHVNISEQVPAYIVTDRTKLHRIILNLLGNAIKFTQSGHVGIDISLLAINRDYARLQFKIIDTGIGIPKALQDKIFDRFFRNTPSYKGVYAGHGIGLHIAESYIKLLGGHIQLTSQVGAGTTFYFDLSFKIGAMKNIPFVIPQNPLAVPAHKQEVWKKTPHLLLIEDNNIALNIVEANAIQAGCDFTSTNDGESALELAKTHSFDLVVTDIGLPGISGNELTQKIREWEVLHNTHPVPIVGLTAHSHSQIIDECLKSGMNAVFNKPIDLNTIQTMVYQFVSSSDNTKAALAKPGSDLPNAESQLFELDMFPLLDITSAIESLGNEALLHDMLTLMVKQEIPCELLAFEKAFTDRDWESIEKLAHKMKGGAVYCGTIKLKYACQYLERYRKSGQTSLLEKLYLQLIQVIQETSQYIQSWLQR